MPYPDGEFLQGACIRRSTMWGRTVNNMEIPDWVDAGWRSMYTFDLTRLSTLIY